MSRWIAKVITNRQHLYETDRLADYISAQLKEFQTNAYETNILGQEK